MLHNSLATCYVFAQLSLAIFCAIISQLYTVLPCIMTAWSCTNTLATTGGREHYNKYSQLNPELQINTMQVVQSQFITTLCTIRHVYQYTQLQLASLLATFCAKHHRVDYWTFLQIELLLSATALIHKYGGHEPCNSLAIHSQLASYAVSGSCNVRCHQNSLLT